MKVLRFPLFILLTITFWACENAEPEQSAVATEKQHVQGLLLTQNFPYDNTDQNKMSGPYQQNERLSVPADLAPQNKWVMFEGPVLENDLIAYRFYLDRRHRNDIYGKRVKDLVMDTVSWNYHDIMDWGSDILKVGTSLGIGSPAIWYQDSIYALENWESKTIEQLKLGDKSAGFRMIFNGLDIAGQKISLQQDWTLNAGEAWSTIELEVLNGQLPDGMFFVTGIVKHLDNCISKAFQTHRYAYTWGQQSFHEEQMGMGILLPNTYQPEAIEDKESHAFVFKNAPQKVAYQFVAAWERDVIGIKDAPGFEKLLIEAITGK